MMGHRRENYKLKLNSRQQHCPGEPRVGGANELGGNNYSSSICFFAVRKPLHSPKKVLLDYREKPQHRTAAT